MSYSEKYRFQRFAELSKLVAKSDYREFVEMFGKETLKEFSGITLFYSYMLIHSSFISAYSSFEAQLTSIAETLEKNIPFSSKIKSFSKNVSVIEKLR